MGEENVGVSQVVVLCHFSPEYLTKILKGKLPEGWKLLQGKDDHSVMSNGLVMPLILCERRFDLRRLGVMCPSEFVAERKDLLGCVGISGIELLRRRVKTIVDTSGIPDFSQIQDWFAGTFRRYLCLDESVHGKSCFALKKNESAGEILSEPQHERIRNTLKKRFGSPVENSGRDSKRDAEMPDEMLRLRPLMEVLFNNQIFHKVKLPLYFNVDISRENDFVRWANSVYGGETHEAIPFVHGDRARFETPSGRFNVLWIDDEAFCPVVRAVEDVSGKEQKLALLEEKLTEIKSTGMSDNIKEIRDEIERIKGSLRQKNQVSFDLGFFNVQPLRVDVQEIGKTPSTNVLDYVRTWLENASKTGFTFDFVLLDLNLGDAEGRDPSGYHLIRVVSQCLPHVPIVAYSQYDDMGHIARALQYGAKWYLKKGDEAKMPRHILQLLEKANWRAEWRAMQDYTHIEFVYDGRKPRFDDRFARSEEWRYLTAKCLERYPGRFISVSQMGGGLSSAVTFKAQKGLVLDGVPLQSPVIVKIDTASNTRMEYERYFRLIRPYMANEAGRVENPSLELNRDNSAIVYTFAGRNDGSHKLASLKDLLEHDILFRSSCDPAKYEKCWDILFEDILPKIHRVTPAREFGGGANRHVEVFSHPEGLDAKPSRESIFPHVSFGEVEKNEFWKSYIARYPAYKKIHIKAGEKFMVQPIAEDKRLESVNRDELVRYVYHSRSLDSDCYVIEALDEDGQNVLLSGGLADHIARFRQSVYPGMSLWLKESAAEREESRTDCFSSFLRNISETVAKSGKSVGLQGFWNAKKNKPGKFAASYLKLIKKIVTLSQNIFNPDSIKLTRTNERRRILLASKRSLFKCPIAICHGDLNFGNIMVELSGAEIKDGWLIDFARTRRDRIAHDFNVLFTATFSLLFKEELYKADDACGQKECKYSDALATILDRFIKDAMFAKNENPPDYIDSDARFSFVYRILRRIRRAALVAGVSLHMYVLTTALECLLAVRLYLKHGANGHAAEAFVKVAQCCFEWLESELELELCEP